MALTRLGLNQAINLSTNTTGNLSLASQVTGTLATGNGGTGATSFSPGKVLQVVNGVSSTEIVHTNNSWTSAGVALSITPSATTSKILVICNMTGVGKASSNTWAAFRLLRDSTNIVANFEERGGSTGGSDANKVAGVSVTFLDTPSSTSALSYNVQIQSGGNSSYAQVGNSNSKSTITLMEIGA